MNNDKKDAHWLRNRKITERIVIKGDLILETPAYFGGGENDNLVDVPLFLDPLEGKALLTGASIAGALRNYLREREHGYEKVGDEKSYYLQLFGRQQDKEGEQSLVIVHDSLSNISGKELRDGVRINPRTRTAQDKKKFDFELLEAGTSFPIIVELLVQDKKKKELLKGLALALKGFENEDIPLGMRKNRGFGRCKVSKWEVCRYNLTDPKELVDWINNTKNFKEVTKIADMLGGEFDLDNRNIFKLKANFSLEGSLLIRSSPLDLESPDSVHLRTKRNGQKEKVPILSGTSLAGALRSRAQRIARTIDRNGKAKKLIDSLFGPDIESLCLFCWDDIPETGNAQLIKSLTRNYFAHINNAHNNKN
jgi:CRISPR/Cas system CSM-associated protein Csm3 (group 7 of RAMP superfamily)